MNQLVRAFICLFMFSLTNAVFADDDDRGIDRGPVYHIDPNVDLIPTTQLEYGRPRIVIKAIVPKLVSNTETEDLGIETYNDTVLALINEEAESFKQEIKSHEEYQNALVSSDIKNDVIIDFDSSILNKNKTPVLSLRFVIHGVISGMSGSYRRHRVLNYNLDTGEIIQLSDLFNPESDYLKIISDNARIILVKKLTEKTMIASGTEPNLDSFKNWNLTPEGLRLTFDSNLVAPAVYGSQTVTIPYAVLKDVINPESFLATCLKRKRSCFSGSVVTGGFIDEAKNQRHNKFKQVASKGKMSY